MVPWLFHAVIIAVAREHQYVLHTVVEHRHTAIQIEIMRPTIRIDRSSEDYTSTICECDMITFAAPLLLAIDADRRCSFPAAPPSEDIRNLKKQVRNRCREYAVITPAHGFVYFRWDSVSCLIASSMSPSNASASRCTSNFSVSSVV